MNTQRDLSDDTSHGHYRTAGMGLILVGLINTLIAIYSLSKGSENVFIDYEVMLTFALTFIGVGGWMRSLDLD